MQKFILFLAALFLTSTVATATDITVASQTLSGFYAPNLPASVTGTVNTSGTTVTWATGGKFLQQWVNQGYTGFRISINGVDYTVSSVTSTTVLTLSSSAGTQTGVSFTVYPFVLLQVFALQSYIPNGSTQVIQSGAPGSGAFYRQYACSVISNTVYIPESVIAATTDATGPASTAANLSAWFYNTNGSRIKVYDCFEQFKLPATPTSTTWAAVCTYNRSRYVPLPTTYYTSAQVDALLDGFFTFSVAGLTGNYIPKVSGTSLVDSGIQDNGSIVSTSRAVQLNSTLSVGGASTLTGDVAAGTINEVRHASAFTGANITAKIQAAIDDLPSTGGIVYANFEGAQSLAALSVNKKLHLILGAGTYTQSAAITVSVPVFILEGQGPHATTIVGGSGIPMITLSGTMTQLEGHLTFRGINFNGAGNATRAINLPTTAQLSEGRILVDNCQFRSFTQAALYLGQSNYYTTVRASEFYANVIGIDCYEYSDIVVSDTTFYAAAAGTSYYIRTRAQNTKIVDSNFVPGGATGGADIQVVAASSNGGYVFIRGNKFGPESENAARYKISIIADADTYVVPRIHVTDNNFFGVDTQVCMLVDVFTQAMTVEQNWFNGFTTIINDSPPAPTATSILRYGENVFRNNKIIQLTPDTYPMRIFANGGENWSVVEAPESAEQLMPLVRLPKESLQGIVNRVINTEVSSAWTKNNVTTTDGITDPLGTTRAVQLQRTAGTANTSVQLDLTLTGLKDAYGATSSGRNGVGHVTFWAQKGVVGTPLSYLAVSIYNVTDSQTVTAHYMELGTGWKRYTFSFIGLDSTKTYRLYFYPGGTGLSAIGGSVNIAFPQMSDYPEADYLATSGGVYSTSTDGARFLNGVSLMKTLAVTGATTLTGNVGIGTASGSNPLSIKVATDTRLLGLNSAGTFLLKSTQDNESTRIPFLMDGSTLTFLTAGTERWGINSSGVLFASTDNSWDIGAAGAFRPRDFHLGRNALIAGTVTIGAGTAISKYLSGTGTAGNGGANIGANACITDTFTVTGAASGDTVIATPPSTIEASLTWNGFVSAADTIKVQICNPTTGALASADLTWRASVIKH